MTFRRTACAGILGSAIAGFTMLMLGISWLIFHRREQNA